MNNRQLTRKLMQGRLGNFFDDYAATFNLFVPLKTEITGFFAKMTVVNALELQQARDFSDLQAAKLRIWKEWVTELVQFACLARAWAMDAQTDIVEQLDVREDELLRMSQEESANRGRDLVRILITYQPSLTAYGISRDMLDSLDEKIEGFEAMIPDTDHAIMRRKDITVDLDNAMDDVTKSLVKIDALIKGKYLTSNPGIVQEYRFMRALGETAAHHTGVRITLYHEGTTDPF